MKKVYVSGGFYGTYKEIIRRVLFETTCFVLEDPEEQPAIPGEYVGRDFDLIRASDIVLAVQTDYPYLYGMAAEIGFAVCARVPVIYVCLAPRIDSFLSGCARAAFTDLEAACRFIIERYGE